MKKFSGRVIKTLKKGEFRSISTKRNDLTFFLNGKEVKVSNPDPTMTLLEYIRKQGLTGTKLVCGEGGCGACTVMVSSFIDGKVSNKSVNSCLAPILTVDGSSVTTVEGVGTKDCLHPVQEAIAKQNGSQCGFCTPGFVMSLYTLTQNNTKLDKHRLEEAFDGNLCRCTGYRPILDAAKSFENNKVLKKDHFPDSLKGLSKSLEIIQNGIKWITPTTLEELIDAKTTHPEAKLVCGNSEIGVETKINYFGRDFQYKTYIYPIHIKELQQIKETKEGVEIGASLSLSSLYDYCRKIIETGTTSQKRVFQAIMDQLRWFSGTQIRNVASLGGNIATASPISDLNPVWVAMDAHLNIISKNGTRTVKMREFFKGYRKIDLKPEEIIHSIYVPHCKENEYVFAYKQAKRREDDIAIVNGAIRMNFNDSIIQDVGISFGGMGPITRFAPETEKFLKGKKFDEKTYNQALEILKTEFKLDKNVPGGMSEFRQTLVLGFFTKFYLSTKGEKKINIERESSKGQQTFKVEKKGLSVGEPMNHHSAKQQVTGEALYTDDLPQYKNELHAAFVWTTISKGTIKKVDASKALKIPGVKAFFTHKDVEHNLWGPTIIKDEELLVSKNVQTIGQIIGVLVAEDSKLAKQAVKLVEVEYEEEKPILTIQDAIKANSYIGEHQITDGNIEKGFKESDIVLEEDINIGGQEHFYFETISTISVPLENNEILIHASTQNLNEVQHHVAHALGMDNNKIIAKCKRIGGGFGGKETRTVPIALCTSLAAKKLGVPVRAVLDRDVDMAYSGQRHPFYAKYKVGIQKNGKVNALEVNIYSNAGYSSDLSMPVLDRSLLHIDSCYKFPNLKVIGKACKTNLPSNTAFRGFGGPQGLFVCETIMDHIASTIGISKIKVREMNFYKEGEETHYGQPLKNWNVPSLWNKLLEKSDYEKRVKEIEKFNKENKLKRGISMIPTKFGIAFTFTPLNQGGALVNIYTDGSVLITHGGCEMGQGLHQKVIQIASTVLNCPVEKIFVSETSTDKVPNSSATAASMGSDLYGEAVKNACDILNQRLQPFREKLGEKATMKDLANAAYFNRVNLSAQGFFAPQNIGFQFTETGKGNGIPFRYFTQGVACSEVEVDPLTGDFTTLRTDLIMDVGHSISPGIDIGQIEGAFIQGVGLFTIEELIRGDDEHPWVKKGLLQTRGPGNYKIPSSNDVPVDFRVHLAQDLPNDIAVMRSKAIGEPPLFLGSSVYFAIKEALYESRKENNVKGYFILDSPATCERIRMSNCDKISEMVIKDKKFRSVGSI